MAVKSLPVCPSLSRASPLSHTAGGHWRVSVWGWGRGYGGQSHVRSVVAPAVECICPLTKLGPCDWNSCSTQRDLPQTFSETGVKEQIRYQYSPNDSILTVISENHSTEIFLISSSHKYYIPGFFGSVFFHKPFYPVLNLPRHSRVIKLFLINPVIEKLFWIRPVLNLTTSFMHLLLIFFNAETFLWNNKFGKCKMQLITAQNCCIALFRHSLFYNKIWIMF